jgi:pyrroline-5-carboxylate reductase
LELQLRKGFVLNGAEALKAQETIILAVKPQQAVELRPIIGPMIGRNTLVISIMAGKTIEDLRTLCPGAGAYVRAMPNLPIAVGRGATVGYADEGCTPAQIASTEFLLGGTGLFEWLRSESLIDIATGLAGSGPAYLFYLADCFTKAGTELGLPAPIAERLSRATLSGAGEMLRLSGKTATDLRMDVTSPSGTTEAGLRVLMHEATLQDLIFEAVSAATQRARELSRI